MKFMYFVYPCRFPGRKLPGGGMGKLSGVCVRPKSSGDNFPRGGDGEVYGGRLCSYPPVWVHDGFIPENPPSQWRYRQGENEWIPQDFSPLIFNIIDNGTSTSPQPSVVMDPGPVMARGRNRSGPPPPGRNNRPNRLPPPAAFLLTQQRNRVRIAGHPLGGRVCGPHRWPGGQLYFF